MKYFLFILFFNITLVLLGLLGSFFTFKKIIKKKIKKAYYLLIIILLPTSIYLFSFNTIPYLKDLSYIKNQNYKTIEGCCSSVTRIKNQSSIILSNKEFHYNPWDFAPKIDMKYRLYYLPNSNFIIKYNTL